MGDTALTFSVLLALGIGAQWLAWHLKQPSILFLLIIGILLGPVSGYFSPDQLLGDLLFPFISLGVAVILFEGSLTLEFSQIKQHGRVVQRLVTLGALITILVLSLSARLLFDMDPLIALLFGSLVCVTGPTVIAPLLRSVRPKKNIANILQWEGIIIDPIGAIAVVLVYEYIISGGNSNSLLLFGKIVLSAAIIGLIGAFVLANIIKRHWLPEFLRNVVTLAFVLLLFTVSNHIEHESGLLTVTVLGVTLANWPKFPRSDILEFNESLTLLLVSMLFIVLAARINLSAIGAVGFSGVVLLLIAMFIARPLAVWVCARGAELSTNEKLMISWIGPRGIVAAAISSLFALRLEHYDLKGVELLVPLVFVIIIGTVLVQGLGAKMVGTLLNVREPVNNGVLIVGSNQAALTIAKVVKNLGYEVLVADNNYTQIAKARMDGLRTYFGNPVSDHAERHLDLIGIGHLFAMSTDQELNTLCEMHFRHDFGQPNIYRLLTCDEKSKSEREQKQHNFSSKWLFGDNVTHSKLLEMISQNARIKTTNITNNYSYEQYCQDNKNAIPLFVIDKNNVLRVISTRFRPEVAKGHKLVALIDDSAEVAKTSSHERDQHD